MAIRKYVGSGSYFLAALFAVVSHANFVLDPSSNAPGEQGGSSDGPLLAGLLPNMTVPVCMEDEFLTSNGTDLICRPLPDPICDCPIEPDLGSGDPPLMPLPQPPLGCPVFEPPTRGAFVCLRNPDIIYCNVYCDHRFEFDSTPRNPYFCGSSTNFQWRDLSQTIRNVFPTCTGFRHRRLVLHPLWFYLPAPCYGLTNHTIRALLVEFQESLTKIGCTDCNSTDNVFIQCPQVNGSALFFNEIVIRGDPYKK